MHNPQKDKNKALLVAGNPDTVKTLENNNKKKKIESLFQVWGFLNKFSPKYNITRRFSRARASSESVIKVTVLIAVSDTWKKQGLYQFSHYEMFL